MLQKSVLKKKGKMQLLSEPTVSEKSSIYLDAIFKRDFFLLQIADFFVLDLNSSNEIIWAFFDIRDAQLVQAKVANDALLSHS